MPQITVKAASMHASYAGKELSDQAEGTGLAAHEGHAFRRLLLALGGVDCTIKLALAGPGGTFHQVCSLTGHADWVRSLAFKHPPAAAADAADAAADSQQGEMLLHWSGS